jgi:hypothetical protein
MHRHLAILVALVSARAAVADPPPADDGPEITCAKPPAAWSPSHPYGAGAQVSVTHKSGAARVYRCKNGCAVGAGPEDAGNDFWTLRGHCASPAAAAPAATTPASLTGSPRWDAKYHLSSKNEEDWRCPWFGWNDTFVVAKGKLSAPWRLRTDDRGNSVDVGRLDATAVADGTVVVTATVTASELPRAITGGGPRRRSGGLTTDALKAAAFTMQLTAEPTRRRAELELNNKCSMTFYAWGDGVHKLAPGEEDNDYPGIGKHITVDELDKYPEHEDGKTYTRGATARQSYSGAPGNIVYRCKEDSCSDSPGSSSDWESIAWW